jgi:hypothetical protein
VTWKLILKACWTEFEEEGGGGKQKFRFMECKQYPEENLYRFIGPRSQVHHVYERSHTMFQLLKTCSGIPFEVESQIIFREDVARVRLSPAPIPMRYFKRAECRKSTMREGGGIATSRKGLKIEIVISKKEDRSS